MGRRSALFIATARHAAPFTGHGNPSWITGAPRLCAGRTRRWITLALDSNARTSASCREPFPHGALGSHSASGFAGAHPAQFLDPRIGSVWHHDGSHLLCRLCPGGHDCYCCTGSALGHQLLGKFSTWVTVTPPPPWALDSDQTSSIRRFLLP